MPRDKDDKDDIAEDKQDSPRPDKPSVIYKTNRVSDINRPAQLKENHVEEMTRQKKKIHFNNDVKIKDSPNHGFTLQSLQAGEMGYTIEEIADPSGDEENPVTVSAPYHRVLSSTSICLLSYVFNTQTNRT